MEISRQVALAPYTTLGVGGPARYFVTLRSKEDAREAVLWARQHDQPLFVLGGGSNLVVSDSGWPGLVARIGITGIEREQSANGQVVWSAGAGENWDGFVRQAVEAGCAGVECLSGIPGSVGGTPVQNVGAYGQEVSETICAVEALDLHSLDFVRLENRNCGFAYRSSRFNGHDSGRYLILGVSFCLHPNGSPSIHYADLRSHFEQKGQSASLANVREAVLEIRRGKAMVVEDSEPDSRSAGSFFKNPFVSLSLYERIAERWRSQGISVPRFHSGDGRIKIPAAWLVEHSGIPRGFEVGAVAVSRKHALALVNRGGATAAEVIKLKDLIQSKVREVFEVELEAEPVFVGFESAAISGEVPIALKSRASQE